MEEQTKVAGRSPRIMGVWGRRIYLLSLIVLVFTGFGQLPLFKRYYISSIPGMAWSADFYTTLFIHYVAGTVFVFLCVYYLTLYLTRKRGFSGRSLLGGVLLALILGSGFLLAVRNMSGASLAPLTAFITVWTHFLATMAFLIAGAAFLFLRKRRPEAVRVRLKR